jgi:hypothetical protein
MKIDFYWIVYNDKQKYFYGGNTKKFAIEFATGVRNEYWDDMKYEGWKVEKALIK